MFLKKLVLTLGLVLTPVIGAQASPVLTLDFSSPVVTGPSPVPGVWHPTGYSNLPVSFSAVGGKLEEVIGSDSSSYHTQGSCCILYRGLFIW